MTGMHDVAEHLAEHLCGLIAAPTAWSNPYFAEASCDDRAHWYVLTTYAAAENRAAAHLAARRFGVYVPETERVQTVRGHRRTYRRKLIPGYVLLFAWRLAANWSRIAACPGVSGILFEGEHPAIIPDALIRAIEGEEWREYLGVEAMARPKRRRRSRWGAKGEAPLMVTAAPKAY